MSGASGSRSGTNNNQCTYALLIHMALAVACQVVDSAPFTIYAQEALMFIADVPELEVARN